MSFLHNSWYQAAWASELADGPLVRTILEEPILLYRPGEDKIAALLDRCPHRFAPLSSGSIAGRVVTCGYHGLAFGPNGACVGNPHGPITSAMRARSYPVMERHLAIWVWMGDPEKADPGALPDLSFIDRTPESARITLYMPTQASYRLLTDNIMDLTHADYLHASSIGGVMTGSRCSTRERNGQVIVEWLSDNCDPPPAFRPMLPPDEKADIWTQVTWSSPALMILGTAAKPAGVPRSAEDESFTLHNMTPQTATSTHYFVCSTRSLLQDDATFGAELKAALTHAFVNEDKPMLERQQERMATDDLWALEPILLGIDAAAVRVRRRLDALISAEAAAA